MQRRDEYPPHREHAALGEEEPRNLPAARVSVGVGLSQAGLQFPDDGADRPRREQTRTERS